MTMVNGVTPLDKDHVQDKYEADSRGGNLTFQNGTPVLTNPSSGFKIAFGVGCGHVNAYPIIPQPQNVTIPFPIVCLSTPAIWGMVTDEERGLSGINYVPFSKNASPTENAFRNKRSCVLSFEPWYGSSNLDSGITNTDNTLTVINGSVFPNPTYYPTEFFFIKIENEILSYSSISGDTLSGVYRGLFNTTPASHSIGKEVFMLQTLWRAEGIATFGGF